MTEYTIAINPEQRALIVKALHDRQGKDDAAPDMWALACSLEKLWLDEHGSFTIPIEEKTRLLITKALFAAYPPSADDAAATADADIEPYLIRDMFDDLPNAERDCPGCVHGFCF